MGASSIAGSPLKCVYHAVVGFLYVYNVLILIMVMAKGKFDQDFFPWCNLRLKFG